jgi:hypothetical protein
MTTREIQGHLLELYGRDVFPGLISTATDAIWRWPRNGRTGPLDQKLAIGIQDEQIARPVEDDAAARPVFVFVRPHNRAQGGIHAQGP